MVNGMEDKTLQAIEELRNDFNKKFDNLSSEIEESTQLLKRLLELIQNRSQIQAKTNEIPGKGFSRAKHIRIVKKDKSERENDRELISFICQEAAKNKYDPDSDPVLKDFRKKMREIT